MLPNSHNIGPFNFTPALSSDGRRMTFASTRRRAGQEAGMADLYEVRLQLPLAALRGSRTGKAAR